MRQLERVWLGLLRRQDSVSGPRPADELEGCELRTGREGPRDAHEVGDHRQVQGEAAQLRQGRAEVASQDCAQECRSRGREAVAAGDRLQVGQEGDGEGDLLLFRYVDVPAAESDGGGSGVPLAADEAQLDVTFQVDPAENIGLQLGGKRLEASCTQSESQVRTCLMCRAVCTVAGRCLLQACSCTLLVTRCTSVTAGSLCTVCVTSAGTSPSRQVCSVRRLTSTYKWTFALTSRRRDHVLPTACTRISARCHQLDELSCWDQSTVHRLAAVS